LEIILTIINGNDFVKKEFSTDYVNKITESRKNQRTKDIDVGVYLKERRKLLGTEKVSDAR